MSKHTPGPWFIGDANIPSEYTHGIHAGDFIVADLCDDAHTPETRKANASLIAAAPELLEALQLAKFGLEAMIEDENCGNSFIAVALTLDKINFAIAKAEGKQ